MATREQEHDDVRRILGDPLDQHPSSDLILCGQFREEQRMYNKITTGGQAWTPKSTSITSVLNQAEYTIDVSANQHSFGKALYVYRDLGNNILLPVPFTDFTSEINNQSYEFWLIPPTAGVPGLTPGFRGEKLAFFRTGAIVNPGADQVTNENTVKLRIYPPPDEAGLIYQIVYAVGALDWSAFTWGDTPLLPEFSALRCLNVALHQLINCEWEGKNAQENQIERNNRKESIADERAPHMEEFDDFLRDTQNEPIGQLGYWWEP